MAAKKKFRLSAQQRTALWESLPPNQKKAIVAKVSRKLKRTKKK